MPREKWDRIAEEIKLSPKQKCIVELILLNRCNKQIEAELGLKHSTLRTHIERIFHRAAVSDRQELVLLLCASSHDIRPPEG